MGRTQPVPEPAAALLPCPVVARAVAAAELEAAVALVARCQQCWDPTSEQLLDQ